MKTCKTCKYWNTKIGRYDHKSGAVKYEGGYCQNEKITEDYGQEYKSDMLIYPYIEGGVFWTGKDFGCVNHEEIIDK